MKGLIHAAAFTTLSTGVTLIMRIARTKLVALTLGVSGVGLLGEVNAALDFATALVTIGFANAIVRRTAAAHATHTGDRGSTLLATAYFVTAILAAPVVLALLLAPPAITQGVLGLSDTPVALVALAIAVPFMSLGGIERAVTQGLRNVRQLATTSSTTAVLGLLLLGPMVMLFGLNGALVHVAAVSLVGYGVCVWARRRASRQAGLAITALARPSLSAVKDLLSFGSANAATRVVETAAMLLVRTSIVTALGVAQNGIYQVIFSLPAQFIGIITGALASYAFPLISGLDDRDEITRAINTALRFALLATTPLIAGLALISRPAIVALYSHEFLPAADFLPFELLGDFWQVVSWALGLSLLGRGHLVAFTVLEIGWSAVFALGSISQLGRLGLWAPTVSYIAAHALLAAATYAYQRSREGFRLSAANGRLLVCSGAVTIGSAVTATSGHWEYQLLYTPAALAVWVLLGTEPVERALVWQQTRGWLRMGVV
ncbi:MAG TPA: oligosaccharide flippase family protein, partial [Chloroflexota bacterium]|nr:oligosaccharide flippase family protein [Chloroflexota bacterium]